jgi:hypothetical protein
MKFAKIKSKTSKKAQIGETIIWFVAFAIIFFIMFIFITFCTLYKGENKITQAAGNFFNPSSEYNLKNYVYTDILISFLNSNYDDKTTILEYVQKNGFDAKASDAALNFIKENIPAQKNFHFSILKNKKGPTIKGSQITELAHISISDQDSLVLLQIKGQI